jgi:predicted TIM-barrel fold metal-dependent hydrolase
VYGNFYFDLSFTLPLAHSTAAGLLEQALGVAPYSKVLYGSDAPGLPDYFWLGGVVWRKGLEKLLGGWVEDGGITLALAEEVARKVLHENAAGLYRVKL